MSPIILIVLFLMIILVASVGGGEDIAEEKSNSNFYRVKPDNEIYPTIHKEPEPETPMQKFRRENTMQECIKRGGILTTGERMEAMYGACEEAAQCFPEDYFPQQEEEG